jgi:hypothetical protein
MTTKLPVEKLCSFAMRLSLYPGEYWCIEPWTENRQHTHHPELRADEQRRRMSTMPEETRENATIYSRYTSGGGAILETRTQCTLSDRQLRNNMRNIEREKGIGRMPQMDGDANAGLSSGANELMMHLETEKQDGKKSYVALHVVQVTTMLTIRAADGKREKEKTAPGSACANRAGARWLYRYYHH